MADGRHLKKSKYYDICTTNWPILTKMGIFMHLSHADPLQLIIFYNFAKSKMAAAAIFTNQKLRCLNQSINQKNFNVA